MEVLVIDIGGSKIKVEYFYHGKGLNVCSQIKTPKNFVDFQEWFTAVIKEMKIDFHLGGADFCLDGIVFAIPGVVENHEQIVFCPNTRLFNDFNLKKWCEKTFKASCLLVNDIEAAIAGEMHSGALKGVRNAIMDTISTGWGGGEIREGRIYPGEPGHIYVAEAEDLLCGCGRKGCAEAFYSGGAVRKRVSEYVLEACERAQEFEIAELKDSWNSTIDGLDPCAYLDQAAKKRKIWAIELYQEIGYGIGRIWASRLNCSSATERIVYTGRFALKGMPFMIDHVRTALHKRLVFKHHKNALIQEMTGDKESLIFRSQTWPESALIGGAILFEQIKEAK